MGRLNRRALFARLQRSGVASRADLAKALGMSQPTAGKIVDDLIRIGLIEETGEAGEAQGSPRAGRPARALRVAGAVPRFVLIQLGVSETRVTVSAAAAPGEDRWLDSFATPGSAREWEKGLRRVARAVSCAGAWGVAVSVPGIVDEGRGCVLFSPNLHWTERVDLCELVAEVWGGPAILVQEERALALGHLVFDPDEGDFLLVDVGDGLGGAVVAEGRLHQHSLPVSGEVGHTPVLGNRRRCGCGAVGCVETLVSTRGLLESFARSRRERGAGDWGALVASVRGGEVPGWLGESLDAAAVAIAGALNVLGLRRVVVTGAVVELGPRVMDRLASAIRRGSMWARFGTVSCVAAPRRRVAGLVAAGIERLVLADTVVQRAVARKRTLAERTVVQGPRGG